MRLRCRDSTVGVPYKYMYLRPSSDESRARWVGSEPESESGSSLRTYIASGMGAVSSLFFIQIRVRV